jgi:hypothetical protein
MEGYSVTEAASVLGVPTERIWELLARGVLAGTPEGETGMRVFLQPRPAPAPPEPRGPNGHSGEPEREMSPFRELLTEFRNLTERYGQALLALGESRGEVAALRSRVDLLEARMDLRLPGGSSWPPPASFPVEHAVIPTAPEPAPPAAPPETPDARPAEERADEAVRHRARGPRFATESFAEALARAEDPSPPELPESLEATRGRESDEATLPREVHTADAVPVAEEAADELATADEATLRDGVLGSEDAVVPGTVVAPDEALAPDEAVVAAEPTAEFAMSGESAEIALQADEDAPAFDESGAVAVHPADADERVGTDVEESTAEFGTADESAEAELLADEQATAFDETEAVTVEEGPIETWIETAHEEEPDAPALEPELESEGASAPAPAADTEASSADEPAPEPAPLDWDVERYTTAIDEPDWFEAEADDAATPTPERPAAVSTPPLPEPATEEEAVTKEAATDGAEADDDTEAMPHAAPTHGPAAEPPDGSAVSDEPAEPAESAPAAPAPLPGSADLDRALDALRRQAIETADDRDEWPPTPPTTGMGPSSRAAGPSSVRPPVTAPGRAYRRLRRIFPG